ncbi:MAG: hypothetical protein LBE36_09645 [Flavobacteriaceae bacterium]|jgi:hypothetical protein|nr:hypothetical protein [Flavobacteriaceae bacterium]
MKKILLIPIFLASICVFSQTISFDQASKSNDPKVVATFIKNNPNHPGNAELKKRLVTIVNNNKTSPPATTSKSTVSKSGTKISSQKSAGTSTSDTHKQQAVDLLNHMFSNDPNSKEAYIQIMNQSNCNLNVKITGKKTYNLAVPANNQNFILVDKGNYTLSSDVCGAKYSSSKNIIKDIMITLNSPSSSPATSAKTTPKTTKKKR